jgi:cysteine-rich repeat protein
VRKATAASFRENVSEDGVFGESGVFGEDGRPMIVKTKRIVEGGFKSFFGLGLVFLLCFGCGPKGRSIVTDGDGGTDSGGDGRIDGSNVDGRGKDGVVDADASPLCGNGVIDEGEECDDGNTTNLDDCLNTCVLNTCGDGYHNPATEECDDGDTLNADECLTDCTLNTCGDGYRNPFAEECDDGNNISQDGCSATCENEPYGLPGSGEMQAQASYVMENGELQQSFWRGGEGYARQVPFKTDGTPDWINATAWSGPMWPTALPGSGEMQAQAAYVMENGELQQSYWRGGEGYARQVPFKTDGTPDWGNATAWSGPIPVADLPGSGDMQAQTSYIMENGELQQSFWRGGEGYARQVPFKTDGTPDWGNATAWSGPIPVADLPGSGDMQAQTSYVMENGELQQSFWRGGEGFYRQVPFKSDGTLDWDNATPWSGPILP